MTARFFADTHIAVYALDADPQRHEQAFAILQRRPVISTQIVNEFINVLTGKQRVPLDRVNRCARILLRRSVFDDIGFFNGTTKASDDEFFQRLGAFTTQHGVGDSGS